MKDETGNLKLVRVFVIVLLVAGCASTEPVSQYTGTPPVGNAIANTNRSMRAVCIGWNRVDPAVYGGWDGALSDCEFDAEFAAEMWQEHGLETRVLLTEEATIEACRDALRRGLDGLQAGDWLIIWISGHGGQTADISGDEADDLDEYICAYDGPGIDDTIAEWLEAVPDGVCVLWICDTCHSGTMHKRPPLFRSSAIPKSFSGQLILISGAAEDGYSMSTGQGGVLSTALHDTGPEGQTPASWAAAVQKLVPEETQLPQYVEYGNVTDDFRHGVICE
jgi:hypothetical protein